MSTPDEAAILTTVAAAVFLGMVAQLVAERFKLPAILPLLLLGMAAGTSSIGLGWVDPSSLGHGLEVFVHLGVAIILFEGGLSLDLRQLGRVGGPVRNLLTVGVAVTAVGGAVLAHQLVGVPWATAALFGAIVTVTGPTVIAPLLRHMIAPREVKTILLSEGLIIDPIGAVLAYLVLQWIERAGVPLKDMASELVLLSLTGAAVGFLAGSLARGVAKSRLCTGELRNLSILAILMMAYMVAEHQAPQSGILAAVVMGMTVSGSGIPDLVPLKAFKEQLTTLVISVLFIILSAQLDVEAMLRLGWRGLAVVGGLMLVVRPLAVMTSIWETNHLGWKERVVLGMTAPRGIVAAAFASLAARELERSGLGSGATFEGMVYLVILITGAWATAMAVILPRVLGYKGDPSRRLTVLIGATPLSRYLGHMLQERGRTVAVVDSSRRNLEELRSRGVRGHLGDARNASTYEQVGVEADTVLLALTPNDELNLLIAQLVHDEFGIKHPVVAMQRPAEEFGSRRHAWIDLFGGRGVDLSWWTRRLEAGEARFLTLDLEREEAAEAVEEVMRERERDVLMVCGWQGSQPDFSGVRDELERFDNVTLLVHQGKALERLRAFAESFQEKEGKAPVLAAAPPPD